MPDAFDIFRPNRRRPLAAAEEPLPRDSTPLGYEKSTESCSREIVAEQRNRPGFDRADAMTLIAADPARYSVSRA